MRVIKKKLMPVLLLIATDLTVEVHKVYKNELAKSPNVFCFLFLQVCRKIGKDQV